MDDLGDFARTECEECFIEEVAEPLERYDKKLFSSIFYPICIGDVLGERYRVDHKLGHGGFATVWVAHDLQDKRDVALKVLTSSKSGEHEIRMHDKIRQSVQDISHLVMYQAIFTLRGDRCNHQVMVLHWRGDCIYDLRLKDMSMATRMTAARQLLEALEGLHEAGIVHRDLNDSNCLWGMVPLDHLSRKAKYETLGRPQKMVLPFDEDEICKQGELVKPLEVPKNLHTDTFYLSDFGLAMKLGDLKVPDGRPPTIFCSPDRLHNKGPSLACDMWSYMCIFAELYLGIRLFAASPDGGAMGFMVKLLGPLPEKWKGHYIFSNASIDSWYDQNKQPSPTFNLRTRVDYLRKDADPAERELVYSILSRGFSYSPEKRLTAAQLLQDPSFKALMDRY